MRERYPDVLLPLLVVGTADCLNDCKTAFPDGATVPTANLHRLSLAVESLLRISDYQRRRIAKHFQRYKAQAALFRLYCARANDAGEPSPSLNSAVTAVMAAHLSSRGRDSAGADSPQSTVAPRERQSAAEAPPVAVCATARHWQVPQSVLQGPDNAKDALDDLPAGLFIHRCSASSSPPSWLPQHSLLTQPQLAPEASTLGRAPSPSQTRQQHVPSRSPPLSQADGPRADLRLTLPRVETQKMKMFPDTPEGHISEVRWFTFQFHMEELMEELEALQRAVHALLHELPSNPHYRRERVGAVEPLLG